MLDTIFNGIFDSSTTSVIGVTDFLLCLGCSLVLGIVTALGYMYKTRYTKSFVFTLAILPAVVCVVIMMVNGNIGTGVAVAGAFSLVRFRSIPGTAKEIGMLFLAMGTGLIAGMGYLGYAAAFTLIFFAINLLYAKIGLGARKNAEKYKTVRITIPESLDYSEIFEDIFKKYTSFCELSRVKSTDMGSMFRLTYDVVLREPAKEKEFIDKIRERNGNLEITVSKQETVEAQL